MADVTVEVVQENTSVNVNNQIVTVETTQENVLVDIGISGPQGPRGTGILNGVGAPDSSTGIYGDFYLNTTNLNLYGPKTSEGWGSPVDLSSSADLGYVHTQSSAASVWTITHGLGFIPNVTVVDSGGSVVEGSYNYPNSNTVILTFNGSFSGKAYLS